MMQIPAITIALNLDEARSELRTKSKAQIELETANKWTARAIAAYELASQTGLFFWIVDAHLYEHEAIEHAAEAGPAQLVAVRTAIDKAKAFLAPTPAI